MRMDRQSAGFRIPVNVLMVVLLIVALVLTAVYAQEGEGGVLHTAQNAVCDVIAPAGQAEAGISAALTNTKTGIENVTADDGTLSELAAQNAELRERLASAEEYRLEAERLRSLLNIKESSGIEGPTAVVIGKSMTAWDQSITINVGTADGVATGMSVVGTFGVVGQVVRAGEHTSTVRLLTDPNSGAAVIVQSSRVAGVVRGSLEGLLYLEDIAEDQLPQVGDVVVTSGLGGSYTAGLMVGTVVSVNKSASNITGNIVVDPNATISALQEVIVVTGKGASSQNDEEANNATPSSSGSATADSADGAASANETQNASSTQGASNTQSAPISSVAAIRMPYTMGGISINGAAYRGGATSAGGSV